MKRKDRILSFCHFITPLKVSLCLVLKTGIYIPESPVIINHRNDRMRDHFRLQPHDSKLIEQREECIGQHL
jgi:hypothetical protein